ncbi:MAG: AarF/UbiB family protein [Elusimicrobia bacterium]|nr:AarF/UbiB family protein [Elusimicrobiota bacterium]
MSRELSRRLSLLICAAAGLALWSARGSAATVSKTGEAKAAVNSGAPGTSPGTARTGNAAVVPTLAAPLPLSGSLPGQSAAPQPVLPRLEVPIAAPSEQAPAPLRASEIPADAAQAAAPPVGPAVMQESLRQTQEVTSEMGAALKEPAGGEAGATRASAVGSKLFDRGRPKSGASEPVAEPESQAAEPPQSDKELIQLRERVDRDVRAILRNEMGGDLGRSEIGGRVRAVLARLEKANGIDPGAVSLHLGSSFIPNAFTTITDTELNYLKSKGRLQATFKNSNVFMSRGLLEGFIGHPDAALAFVLAHELAHNRLGHLKSLGSSSLMLGHLLEFEADTEALSMIARAGYDPREALDALELIEGRVEALKRDYPLLQRGQSEYQKLLMRWRDVHPNHALRRANLEDHLSQALEAYRASPMREQPQGALAAIGASLETEPVRDEAAQLEERLAKAVEDPKLSFYDKVVAMEGLLTQRIRERQAKSKLTGQTETVRYVGIEDQMIVENAVRALAAKARSLDDLNSLYQIHQRIALLYPALNFPSHRAMAAVITRQWQAAAKLLGPRAAVPAIDPYVGKVSLTATQALFNIYLKRIDSPEAFDAALEYLGHQALPLGYSPGTIRDSMAESLARTLIAKSLALAVPQDLPPAERLARAIEHLRAKVPAILLVAGPQTAGKAGGYLSTYLKAELIDFYFTGRAGADPAWSLPEVMLLLEGREREDILSQRGAQADYSAVRAAGAMVAWNERYFKAQGAELSQAGSVVFNYERLDTKGIVVPKASELLEILSILPYRRAEDRDKDESDNNGSRLPLEVPETMAAAILKHDASWQEGFWQEAAAWLLKEYVQTKEQPGSLDTLKRRLQALAELQSSVVRRSQSLAPLSAALRGTTRALREAAAGPRAGTGREALSAVADYMITNLVNSSVADQLELARDSEAGIALAELQELTGQILELDGSYSSFNTTERLRALGSAFYYAASHGKDLLPLTAYVRSIMRWTRHKGGNGASGQGTSADGFAAQNKALFREAGLAAQYQKLPSDVRGKLTSGALGLMGDPRTTAAELLGASLAVYLEHQNVDNMRGGHDQVRQGLALLLIEEAGRRIRSPEEAKAAAEFLRRVHDLDPFYISYVPRTEVNTDSRLYGRGAADAIRTEVLGALAARKQPFRERDAGSVRALLERIQQAGGWPAAASDQLALLDWAGRIGDYDSWVDDQILAVAKKDPAAFEAWAKEDEDWTRAVRKGEAREPKSYPAVGAVTRTLEKLLGLEEDTIKLPELRPAALRLVRNPVRRAELYRLLRTGSIPETARHGLKDLPAFARLTRSSWAASRYFSAAFLRSVVREASPDARIVMVLQETSRVADDQARLAEARWNAGQSSLDDVRYLQSWRLERASWRERLKMRLFGADSGKQWAGLSESEKRERVEQYRGAVFRDALARLMALHDRYAAFLDPELGFIIDSFPEPNRTRDDLLERLAKSRRLTPESLGVIESYKSYRLPNPLRFVEKQFMEVAGVQLAKLSPAERVDLILHIGGVRHLDEPALAKLEARMLGRDRRVFVEKNLNIYSFRQYLKYLDQLHPEDKELFVKSMFYGKGSISEQPEQVERLYRAIAVDGRGLPPLVERVMLAYYQLLTPPERIKAIIHMTRASRSDSALSGPEIVRSALENFGITGAKIGQVLATHRGLLPPEYAAALEKFKDGAQSLEKAKVLAMLEKRFALLRGAPTAGGSDAEQARRLELAQTAQKLYPAADALTRQRYVEEVLALERIRSDGGLVSDIQSLGRELGSGSVKIAYKVTLKDGSTWVAKVRRPGATVDFKREFEVLEALTSQLMDDPALKLPNLSQLAEEVRTLVLSELDFLQEAEKNRRTAANVAQRGRAANLLKSGGRVLVADVHPSLLAEDLALDEFVPSVSFKALPERGVLRVSKRSLSRAIVDEASQALIVDEYLDPDRHTGNILQKAWFGLPWPVRPVKPVWIDLGQSVPIPYRQILPFLKAGLALKYERPADAAADLAAIFTAAPEAQEKLTALLAEQLALPGAGVLERILNAIVKAEAGGFLVRPEQAALEKAMILLNGYSQYLPADYMMHSLERAVMLRALKRDRATAGRLAWLRAGELLGGDRYAGLRRELEGLGR